MDKTTEQKMDLIIKSGYASINAIINVFKDSNEPEIIKLVKYLNTNFSDEEYINEMHSKTEDFIQKGMKNIQEIIRSAETASTKTSYRHGII